MTKSYAKYLIAIMILFIISFAVAGCNKEDDFIEVSSVTFTSGGQNRTVYSTWYIKTGKYEVSTRIEYNKAEFKSSVTAPNDVDVNTISDYTSDCFSGNIYDIGKKSYNPHNISKDDIGKYFYIYAHDSNNYNTSFYRVKIKDVGATYVKVKVIDNTTIVVRVGSVETTYTVTSYSIRK